jgi:hypothetical protein
MTQRQPSGGGTFLLVPGPARNSRASGSSAPGKYFCHEAVNRSRRVMSMYPSDPSLDLWLAMVTGRKHCHTARDSCPGYAAIPNGSFKAYRGRDWTAGMTYFFSAVSYPDEPAQCGQETTRFSNACSAAAFWSSYSFAHCSSKAEHIIPAGIAKTAIWSSA